MVPTIRRLVLGLAAAVLAAACGAPAAPARAPAHAPAGAPRVDAAVTIAAAGDISPPQIARQASTARLVTSLRPTRVLALGDLQYPRGELADFRRYYDRTWGRFKSETRPVPGNHEYLTPGARGYTAYWGRLARPQGHTYYSFDLGRWHLVALDSGLPREPGSAQARWLRADLAATSARCVLAYWHHPRFSSGARHGNDTSVATFWAELYDRRGDVVLNGHEHNYERFAPQTPGGSASAAGIREFVVGTGGNGQYPFGTAERNSEKRLTDHWGVLELTLAPASYSWRWVEVGGRVLDRGGPVACH
jgi:hypothetical protein